MYFTSLLLSIGAGLVVVAIAHIFIRRAKWGRGAYYTAFIAGALGFWLLLDDTVTPTIRLGGDAISAEEALERLGYYEALVAYDSAEARRTRQRIEQVFADPKLPRGQRTAALAELLGEHYNRYAPRASDAAVIDFLGTQERIVNALLYRDTNACYDYLRGKTLTVDQVRMLVGKDILFRDSIAARRLIESGIRTPAVAHDSTRALALMRVAYDSLFARDLTYADLMSEPSLASVRRRDYCVMMRDLYRIVLAMPRGEREVVARALVGRRR